MAASGDRRVARTRNAVVTAFNHLFFHRKPGKIRVADIVEQANVGRSTFYDHYTSAEDVHLEALSRPLAILADAAAGRNDPGRLTPLLVHVWDNRQHARETFDKGRMQDRTSRLLADLIEERLQQTHPVLTIPLRLAALQLAETALAPIRGWMTGAAYCTPETLAKGICVASAQVIAALTPGPSCE